MPTGGRANRNSHTELRVSKLNVIQASSFTEVLLKDSGHSGTRWTQDTVVPDGLRTQWYKMDSGHSGTRWTQDTVVPDGLRTQWYQMDSAQKLPHLTAFSTTFFSYRKKHYKISSTTLAQIIFRIEPHYRVTLEHVTVFHSDHSFNIGLYNRIFGTQWILLSLPPLLCIQSRKTISFQHTHVNSRNGKCGGHRYSLSWCCL